MTMWTFKDTATGDTWEMPINPDTMTSPWPTRAVKNAAGNHSGLYRIRTMVTEPVMTSWQWTGVIRTEQHYDDLATWAKKTVPVHVTDHLGRTWEVVFKQFDPVDRKPTANVPWRLTYTMTALVFGRVS